MAGSLGALPLLLFLVPFFYNPICCLIPYLPPSRIYSHRQDLFSSCMIFVQSCFLNFAQAVAFPDPNLHMPQSYFFKVQPKYYPFHKSSHISHCRTIGILISLKPSLISRAISIPPNSVLWVLDWSCLYYGNYPVLAQVAFWPAWVPGVEEHSLGLMTQKLRKHCWGKRPMCIFVCIHKPDTYASHIHEICTLVA